MTQAGVAPPTDSTECRDIGWAIKQLDDGLLVRRLGWNGVGLWLGIVTGAQWGLSPDLELRI